LISNELINHEYDGINGFFLPYTTQAKLSVKVNLISKNNNLRKIVFEKNVSFIQAQNFFDEIVFSTDNDTAKNDI
jgi:hypothetical protein